MGALVGTLGALGVAVLTLAACGGDEDEGTLADSQGPIAIYDWEASLVTEGETGGITVSSDGEDYALGGDPALTSEDVRSAAQSFSSVTSQPTVEITLTDAGQRKFLELTRTLAQRGRSVGEPQHFAVVVEGEALSLPPIDFEADPRDVDAQAGIIIEGEFTIDEAAELAELIAPDGS